MGNLSAGGLAIIRVSVSMLLLDVFSVSLRLLARQHSTVKFAMDDFWVILALLLSIANIGVEIWSKGNHFQAAVSYSDLIFIQAHETARKALTRPTCLLRHLLSF